MILTKPCCFVESNLRVLTEIKIDKAYKGSRSDDTSTLKSRVILFALEDPLEPLVPSLANCAKIMRGFNHPQLCELLLPAEQAEEDDEE